MIPVKGNVAWVGYVDWELRSFHGREYSTHRGSSYNAYVVREEKTVLLDTVWAPYDQGFVDALDRDVGLANLDAIVMNHSEVDHSGALPELLRRRPDLPVYCTANGARILKGLYHQDWNFVTVKTGDSLDVGNGKKLVFVEMRMLHWPDSMATYLTGDDVLFSNDAFGQHFASATLFDDAVDRAELMAEALKYYANILTPYSALVRAKIQEVLALGLPIDLIAPSHGVIWRDDPTRIVRQYLEWAQDYRENQVTVLYDTMWDGTRTMADAIVEGLRLGDPTLSIKAFNVSRTDKNDVVAEAFRSKGILVGSPTVNHGITTSLAGVLEEIEGLRFQGKTAAAFGTYGWSGEAVAKIGAVLARSGFALANAGLKVQWNPDEKAKAACVAFGRAFAEATRGTAGGAGGDAGKETTE